MKKALKIIGIIVLLFIAALIIIPFAFKGKIIELIRNEANKNLNATLDFSDVDLSLIRSFPNLSVQIEDLSIANKEPFLGDTLVSMKNLELTLNVMSVIRGEQIIIKRIFLDEPNLNVKVLKDGTANYDIAIPSDSTVVEEPTEVSDPVSLTIKEYGIKKGNLVYDDASLEMVFAMGNFDHNGKGDFGQDVFTLYTKTEIEKLNVDYGGIKYMKDVKTGLKADIAMDMTNMKFTFMDNLLEMNRLKLAFDGWLAMPADDIDMDLTFSTKDNDLKSLISLIPAYYAEDLDGIKAEGKFDFSGMVKGVYNDNSMPAFAIQTSIEKGRVQYPDLPRSIENIELDLKVASPEGNDLDLMTIDVAKFHMELGKTATQPNTIDATLALRQPMTDPNIKTKVDADLDLGTFKDLIPMENIETISGILAAHFSLDGRMSDIENQRFDEFQAGGTASLMSFNYKDADLALAIPEAKVSITPQKLDLETLKMTYDAINMQMNGYVDNYIAYALLDTTLHGVFNFTADRIDLNKYMATDTTATPTPTETVESNGAPTDEEPALVPDNLDIVLNAAIGELIYDNLSLKNMKGQITVRNSTASMKDVDFETLDGSMRLNGSYNTQDVSTPKVDFAYNMKNIDIPMAFEAFNTVQTLAPIAQHAKGKINSDLSIVMDLTAALDPVYETMNGRGSLSSPLITLEGGNFLQKLASTLKSPKLARQEIKDVKATFVIENGKVITEPFDVKINSINTNISGYSSFDQQVDYLLKMKVPRAELGGDFNKMAEGLLSQANSVLGANVSLGEFINIGVRVNGAMDDPTITPSFEGMEGKDLKNQAIDAVKEEVKERVDEAVKDVRKEASEQADKIIADAQKQADALIAESKKQAKALRDEADKQAKNLEAEATNPFTKQAAKLAGDKLKKEADKQANNLEAEAKKRADGIMAKARAEAAKINP